MSDSEKFAAIERKQEQLEAAIAEIRSSLGKESESLRAAIERSLSVSLDHQQVSNDLSKIIRGNGDLTKSLSWRVAQHDQWIANREQVEKRVLSIVVKAVTATVVTAIVSNIGILLLAYRSHVIVPALTNERTPPPSLVTPEE